ncbi:hypothetical protein SUGI_0824850 [Cryptomeria japonica]|nr:hypothetical protein SUGI_0824850 [Cryptomeria japonica]
MVVSAGGDLPPPPMAPSLDPALLTLSATSSVGPTAVPPSVLAVPQFDGPPLESPQDTSLASNFDPIPAMLIVLSSEPLAGNMNLKGWKKALVRKSDTVDPNFVLVYSQSEEGTSFELPDVVLDHILQNMTNILVGKFFSLRPIVEMVQKWVKDKWKLKGSVYKCHKSGHAISQCKAPTPPLLKLKGLTLGEDSVPNTPIIHHDLVVGPVIPHTPSLDLPPLAAEDPIIEEYPFAESIINLLQSPAKIMEEASILARMVQCMSLTPSLVSLADQLEDGEIVRDPSLVPETTRSPLKLWRNGTLLTLCLSFSSWRGLSVPHFSFATALRIIEIIEYNRSIYNYTRRR